MAARKPCPVTCGHPRPCSGCVRRKAQRAFREREREKEKARRAAFPDAPKVPCLEGCRKDLPCRVCALRETKRLNGIARRTADGVETTRSKRRESARKYRAKYPLRNRVYRRLWNTGQSEAYFQAQMEKQGGQCAICPALLTTEGDTRAVADHCHASLNPRGILCSRCNIGLGWLEHALTASMQRYLSEWRDIHADPAWAPPRLARTRS